MRDYHKKNIQRIRGSSRKKRRKKRDYKKTLYKLLKFFYIISSITGIIYCSYLGYHYLIRTPYLFVTNIHIEGVKMTSEDELINMMNLGPDRNILTIRLKALSDRTKVHPWVEEVTVRREFPQSLAITIKERVPVAIVNQVGLHYLDINGVIFTKVIAGGRMDFPILTGFDFKNHQENQINLQEELKKGIELLEIMEKEKIFFKKNISEINREIDGGFTIFTSKNAFQIKIGSNNFKEKIIRLKYAIADMKKNGKYNGIERINLTYQNRAVVKFKEGYLP